MRGFGTLAARPSELLLLPEVTLLTQGAGYFTPKSFGGPSEPEASLGEPGFKKMPKMTFLPLPLGIFAFLIKTFE